MRILGIGDHVNCGSALIEDGKVIAAINDERLVREKMVFGIPRESIKMIMSTHNIDPASIDCVAVASQNQHLYSQYMDFRDGWFGLERGGFKSTLFKVASSASKLHGKLPFLEQAYSLLRQPAFAKRRKELRRIFRDEFGLDCPVVFLDHHYCHAASAYYTSGYEDATVVSVDGGGDGKSCRVYAVSKGRFTPLYDISTFDSIGNFYAYVTQVCGFKAGRHEGKITGLAAYGEPKYIPQLRKVLHEEDGIVKNVANVFYTSALKKIEEVLPGDFSHKDLAASIQTYTEQMVTHIVEKWVRVTGFRNVALAGGVTSNVKINQRVYELPEVESVFVHPGMSDEGIAVGAALAAYHSMPGVEYDPSFKAMDHVYLGPEYSDIEVKSELDKQQVEAAYYENVEEDIARLLADDAVVARFNGRMEYGPRALGNRTILYRPNDPSVNYWMNDALKRTEFMPFAPVSLTEESHKLFKGLKGAENTARFMTITFDCTDWMAENCPGVVHIDNTARPQLVDANDNPSMHRVLGEYQKLTGLPCLINTSFNMHEEPIVCSPYDAIRAFKMGQLDYLAIGNWIAKNPVPAERKADMVRYEGYVNRQGPVRV